MHPIKIEETNHVFTRPENMTAEECFDMPVAVGINEDGLPEIIVVWEFTDSEINEIIKTKRFYHGTLSAGISPMWMSVVKPKFPVMPQPQQEGKIIGINGDLIRNN